MAKMFYFVQTIRNGPSQKLYLLLIYWAFYRRFYHDDTFVIVYELQIYVFPLLLFLKSFSDPPPSPLPPPQPTPHGRKKYLTLVAASIAHHLLLVLHQICKWVKIVCSNCSVVPSFGKHLAKPTSSKKCFVCCLLRPKRKGSNVFIRLYSINKLSQVHMVSFHSHPLR